MKTKWLRGLGMAAALALASLGVNAADEGPKLADHWTIEVKGNAKSAGEILLRVTPNQGTASDVKVTVANARNENDIAKDIRDALGQQLPPDRYTVRVDDGEDVELKAVKGQPEFLVEFVSSGVAETQIKLRPH
jgi:hypothetical protein